MKKLVITSLMLFFVTQTHAAIRTEAVEYKQGETMLEGYLAYDDTITGPRPGVLVFHEWWGINDYSKQRARQLASLGYVAFAADVYGKGVLAKTPQEAMALAGRFRGPDRSLMRERAGAALDVLKRNKLVDHKIIAAIGYCFGGTVALELARSGAAVAGTVSFHGGLATPNPGDAKAIKGKILALTGADDPHVQSEEILAFEGEMRKAGVDWELVAYGNAVHGFTNPANGTDNSKGVAYNKKADKRSWGEMKRFFDEIFH